MPDFSVDGSTRLDAFLRKHRVQQWRIPILVAKGGVVATRGGGKLTLKNEETPLRSGDKVTLVTPPPSACVKALQREATGNWRDYAIAPGDTPFDKRLAKFVQAREKTIVLQSPLLFTFKGLLEGLATSPEIANPIRHLLFVGHGGLEGSLKGGIDRLPIESITYEMLEEAVKKKTLVVDTSLFQPRPVEDGKTYGPELRILGCLIGSSAPFMKKLGEAFGNSLRIYAPKHLAVGATIPNPPGEAAYMAYAFNVFVPAKVANKAALVNLLAKKPEYMLENRSKVPKRYWDLWVSKDPNANFNALFPPEIPNHVALPVFGGRSNAPRRFVAQDRHLWKGGGKLRLDKDTGKDADRKKAVKAYLAKVPVFQDSHPLPAHIRLGYRSLDDFMDGWTWNFSYDKKDKVLSYDPVRIEYRMLQPIISEAKKTLVMNYYPTGKIPKRFKGRLPIVQLHVRDPFYFGFA